MDDRRDATLIDICSSIIQVILRKPDGVAPPKGLKSYKDI